MGPKPTGKISQFGKSNNRLRFPRDGKTLKEENIRFAEIYVAGK